MPENSDSSRAYSFVATLNFLTLGFSVARNSKAAVNSLGPDDMFASTVHSGCSFRKPWFSDSRLLAMLLKSYIGSSECSMISVSGEHALICLLASL